MNTFLDPVSIRSSLIGGSGAIIVDEDFILTEDNELVTLISGDTITINAELDYGDQDVTFTVDNFFLNNSLTSTGTGAHFEPITLSQKCCFGWECWRHFRIRITADILGNLTDGFEKMLVGNEDGTGDVNVESYSFIDP